MMTEVLKPCPCCGGIPAIVGIVTSSGLVWRLRLGNGQDEDYPTREDARSAWNRRVNMRKEAANDEGENIRPSSPDAGEVREDAE